MKAWLVALALAPLCASAASPAPSPDKVLFLEDGEKDARFRDRFEETLGPGVLVVSYSIDGGKVFDGLLQSFAPRLVVARREPPPATARALKKRGQKPLVVTDAGEIGASASTQSFVSLAKIQLQFGDDRGARANAARAKDDPAAREVMAEVAKDQNDNWLAIRTAGDRDAGFARLAVGDYAGAEEAFKRADPADLESLRGLALAVRQRPREALAAAQKAGAHRLAAEIRWDLGDKEGAEGELKLALQSSADDLEALWDMVRFERDASYAQRAFAAAGRAPSWARGSAYRLSARIWLELDDERHAAESLRRAIALNPEDIQALNSLEQLHDRSPAPAVTAAMPGWSAPDPLDELRRGVDRVVAGPRPLQAVDLARRFTAAIRYAPAWQQADAYREATRMWIDLGYPWKACLTIRESENLDQLSVETQTLISQLRAHLPGLEVDGPRSQQLADIDRDTAKLRAETARLRAILLP